MFRVLHVLFVGYALLACPYRCLGQAAAECTGAEQTRSCSCCDHSDGSDHPENERQKSPAPAEPCKCNCLCQGAVLSKDDVLQAADWQPLFLAVLPASAAEAPLGLAAVPCDFRSQAALQSGRSLRFALQSLQI